jgi:hypothetical protein
LSLYENRAADVVGNSVRKLCNSLNMVGFWDVTPYSLVDIFWYFRARPNLKSGQKGKAEGEIMLHSRNGMKRTDEDGEPRA